MSVGRFLCSRHLEVPTSVGSVRVWERQGTQCVSVCVLWVSASQCLRFVCASPSPPARPRLCLQTPSGQRLSASLGLSSQLSAGLRVRACPSLSCACVSLCLCMLWGQTHLYRFCSGCPHGGVWACHPLWPSRLSLVLSWFILFLSVSGLLQPPACLWSDSGIE